ncbi:hypothetical protein JCM16303_005664 [Sporobolomyces ruberrimus]
MLYFVASLIGMTLLLVIASIFVRYFKGIFWIVQLSHSPTLIRPHFSLSWSSVSVVMLALFEAYLFQCIADFLVAYATRLIGLFGGECAAWSLGVSFLTHVQASGGDATQVRRWARVSNFAGVLSPWIYLAIMLPFGLMTGRHFHEAVSVYLEVDAILQDAARTWEPGTPLNILALTPALPLVQKLETSQSKLINGWKWTYGAYSILTFLLVAVLTSIAVFYLASLRRRINSTARELQGIEESRSTSQQIRLTYRTLQWTIGAFVLLGTVFVSIATYAAANPASLQHPNTAQFLVLGPLWAFGVLGLPTSVSLLWRAIDAKSSDSGGKWSERSGSHSGGGGSSRSRQQQDLDAVKQFSIELGGRKMDRGQVNVTVDVLVKEEGELEKWESLSSASKL